MTSHDRASGKNLHTIFDQPRSSFLTYQFGLIALAAFAYWDLQQSVCTRQGSNAWTGLSIPESFPDRKYVSCFTRLLGLLHTFLQSPITVRISFCIHGQPQEHWTWYIKLCNVLGPLGCSFSQSKCSEAHSHGLSGKYHNFRCSPNGQCLTLFCLSLSIFWQTTHQLAGTN